MSTVLDRDALEKSPLADLHLIANELGVDGFRRLRKADLIDAIIARSPGTARAPPSRDDEEPEAAPKPRPAPRTRRRPGGRAESRRGRRPRPRSKTEAEAERRARPTRTRPNRARRGRRGGRGRGRGRDEGRNGDDRADRDEREARRGARAARAAAARTGGRGRRRAARQRVRLHPPQPARDDRRGRLRLRRPGQALRARHRRPDLRPRPRSPRRSERFPSLVRVDTINGRPADEVAEGTKFEDLPRHVADRADRARLRGRHAEGGRVAHAVRQGLARADLGGPRAGKSELARGIVERAGRPRGDRAARRARRRAARGGRRTGASPRRSPPVTFAASPDAQAQAVEQAIEQGRRVAARGGDAVVVVDTLEYLPPHLARRALAAARNIADGGSLTVVATAPAAFGGEITVVALDAQLTALRRFPALDLPGSGTLRADALVGRRRRRGDRQGARGRGRTTEARDGPVVGGRRTRMRLRAGGRLACLDRVARRRVCLRPRGDLLIALAARRRCRRCAAPRPSDSGDHRLDVGRHAGSSGLARLVAPPAGSTPSRATRRRGVRRDRDVAPAALDRRAPAEPLFVRRREQRGEGPLASGVRRAARALDRAGTATMPACRARAPRLREAAERRRRSAPASPCRSPCRSCRSAARSR